MYNVVLDTNVFISSIFWARGHPHHIIQLALDRKIHVFVTEEVLEELEKVMRIDFEEPEEIVQRQLALILGFSTVVSPEDVGNVVKMDPEDDKLLRCARRIHADYLISGDKHLLALTQFRNTKIVSPKEFVDMFRAKEKNS